MLPAVSMGTAGARRQQNRLKKDKKQSEQAGTMARCPTGLKIFRKDEE